jgi:DNA-directed RNA polymerase sigma subunit (sigma70/sigma32)
MIINADIMEMLVPIRKYIETNDVLMSEAHIVVLNHFPSNDKVQQITQFLCEQLPEYNEMTRGKAAERTRQILATILNEKAREIIRCKRPDNCDEEFEDEIDEIMSDWQWDDSENYFDEDIPFED